MTDTPEERIAELLRALPPAPAGWVQAAKELPPARRELDAIVMRAERDAAYRAAVLADLEQALRSEQLEPTAAVLDHLRSRLRA